MSKAQAKKIVKKYVDKLKAEKYPFSAVYLFGSYSKGKVGEWSDIDVAIVSDKLKKNWWKNEVLLSHLSLEIDNRIEPHGFTIKDFQEEKDPIVSNIKQSGIKIA